MRVVGGRFRGRTLAAPKGRATRPTSDRARETLFNVLVHSIGIDFNGIRVIDLFAGAGGLGFEALSRGAAHVTFVDNDAAAIAAVRANGAALGVAAEIRTLRADATRPSLSEDGGFALAFLDPPYGKGLAGCATEALIAKNLLAPGAIVVVETGAREAFSPAGGFTLLDEREIGAACIRIFCFEP